MAKLNPGDVYYAFRSDIEPPHNKYQLYFDNETVLLINTDKSRSSISVHLPQKDCPILEYDSNICIDNVFTYQKHCEIMKVNQLSTRILEQLKTLVRMSNLLTGKQIKRIEKAIALILAERNLF